MAFVAKDISLDADDTVTAMSCLNGLEHTSTFSQNELKHKNDT